MRNKGARFSVVPRPGFFPVVYFSRGTLHKNKGREGHYCGELGSNPYRRSRELTKPNRDLAMKEPSLWWQNPRSDRLVCPQRLRRRNQPQRVGLQLETRICICPSNCPKLFKLLDEILLAPIDYKPLIPTCRQSICAAFCPVWIQVFHRPGLLLRHCPGSPESTYEPRPCKPDSGVLSGSPKWRSGLSDFGLCKKPPKRGYQLQKKTHPVIS